MPTPEQTERLHSVYAAQDNQALTQLYDAWAEEYDRDMLSYGYKLTPLMAGLIGRYVGHQDGRVLDAGAGTGILGENLALLGYRDLVGIDLSQAMLDVAHKKGVYRDLRQMVLGEHLDLPTDAFCATAAMGVFTEGHAPHSSFDELIRVTRPGGHIIFSIRTDVYLNDGFKEKQDALEEEGKWRLVEMTDSFQALPLVKPEIMHQIFVYQVS